MQICSRTVEAIRSALSTGRALPQQGLAEAKFTLPGLVNAISTAWNNQNSTAFKTTLAGWMSEAYFSDAWRIWTQGNVGPLIDVHGTRALEFFAFQKRADQTCLNYQMYQQRFVRSLKAQGVTAILAHAFAGALSEMTDNIVQHSADGSTDRYRGIAGYHIQSGYFSFAVADVGRGVLASLVTAPEWKHLATSDAALSAVVREHATRREGHTEGEGFKELFRSMVDRNCQLRFRTGDALLSFEDAGHSRLAIGQSCATEVGFQMSCVCALSGKQDERVL